MFTLRSSFLAMASLALVPLHAVQVRSNAIDNKQIFGIQFPGEGRAFYGRENAVASVSLQEYVTAAYKVTEINLVTEGDALLRIYYSRTLKPAELRDVAADATSAAIGAPAYQRNLPSPVLQAADRAANVADTVTASTVVKEYPLATHAHTIEYRVRRRDELLDLFKELQKHWLKKPAFFVDGQIVDEGNNLQNEELKPRSLGGTLFTVKDE
ncbi:hypothetical protein [Coraliomargarita parva]|uniref:hypothetical protein n=1 Tax=Coraliomargarita parva TaxID=3014050 RepID=UPI0022B5872D|nr:hypothetical protein [Coraliomargarita parva]